MSSDPRPTFLSLPRYIFLHNGKADECKMVADALTDYLPNPIVESFLEPVKGMIVGAYYEAEPYEGYIAFDNPSVQCRNSKKSLATLTSHYRAAIEQIEGCQILGKFALDRCERGGDLFSNFIFYDADHGYEIAPFVQNNPSDCLIVLAPGMVVSPSWIEGPFECIWATPPETILKLKAQQKQETAQ